MELVVKNLPANAGDIRDAGTIPGSGRSSGGGHGNPLQYSCLENPMHRGAWRATVHGVTNSKAQLSSQTTKPATHGGQWGAVQCFLALSSYSSDPECL